MPIPDPLITNEAKEEKDVARTTTRKGNTTTTATAERIKAKTTKTPRAKTTTTLQATKISFDKQNDKKMTKGVPRTPGMARFSPNQGTNQSGNNNDDDNNNNTNNSKWTAT
eukprot:5954007-Amphidinium_carterae.2